MAGSVSPGTDITGRDHTGMFTKILYPTDFSDIAMKAFDVVKQLKDAGAEEVIILHVIDSRFFDAMAWYATKDLKEIERDLNKEAKNQVKKLEDELKEAGFKATVRIEEGIPSSVILKIERDEGISAIVIGSHGTSNLQEILIGSVSEKVIRRAESMVLVVKR